MKANLRYRIKTPLILFALLTLVITFSSCRTDEVEVPPLTGPSGHRLFITMDANPEHLVIHDPGRPRETSVITVCLKNQLGQGVPGEGIKLRIANDQGSEINIGTLSDFNITTGSDGCARVVYTAPDSNEQRRSIRVYIRAILTNAAHAFEVTGQHALDLETSSVDPGPGDCIQGPGSPIPSFSFTPSPGIINEPVCFDAQASVDNDGQIVDVSWNFGDGFTGSGFNVCHTFTDFGLFNVTLTVEDEDHNCAQLTQIVEVSQGEPGACTILISPTPVEVDDLVRFTAIVTDDSRVRRFQWSFGDGGTATTSVNTVTHRYQTAGTFQVVITMTDDQGNISTCQTTVTVTAPGAPTCAFTTSPTTGVEIDETVFFNASQSVDVDGNPVETFRWDFGDGTAPVTESDPIISHVFTQAGTFTVTLTVTDANDVSSICTQTITISAGEPPTAALQCPPGPIVDAGGGMFNVTLNASASSDPDGTIVEYRWTFGDGDTAVTATSVTTHTYDAGTFTASVRVVDDDGNVSAPASCTFTVGNAPTCSIDSQDPNPSCEGEVVNFMGTGTDPDGGVVMFSWDFGDGGTSTQEDPSHIYTDATGSPFSVTLTVTDDELEECTAGPVQHTVLGPPTITQVNPDNAAAGEVVVISGSDFASALEGGSVSFNGTAAESFTVNAARTTITATIAAGTPTGLGTVEVDNGCASDTASFTVNP